MTSQVGARPRLGRIACLAVLCMLALRPHPAHAVPAGFAFLEIPGGSRASALGGAFGTIGDGVEAVFWNPAGLAGTRGTQVTGSHYEMFESLRSDQFAIAGRMFGGGLAASLRALYSEPIEERDEVGNLIGTFGANDLEFTLAYGYEVLPGVRVGGSTHALHERIANVAASTYAFGLGATWDVPAFTGLRVGGSVQNWGADGHFNIDGDKSSVVPLPVGAQAGASYSLPVAGGLQLRGALESRVTRGRQAVGMLGAELAQPAGAALRFGLRVNDDASSFSVGAGYMLSALRLDYAYVPFRLDLGDTHRLSFAAQF